MNYQQSTWDQRMVQSLKQLDRLPYWHCVDCGHVSKTVPKQKVIECPTCGFVVDILHAKAVWLSGEALLSA